MPLNFKDYLPFKVDFKDASDGMIWSEEFNALMDEVNKIIDLANGEDVPDTFRNSVISLLTMSRQTVSGDNDVIITNDMLANIDGSISFTIPYKPKLTNTGPVGVTVNDFGPKEVVNANLNPMSSGDLNNENLYFLKYDTSIDKFILPKVEIPIDEVLALATSVDLSGASYGKNRGSGYGAVIYGPGGGFLVSENVSESKYLTLTIPPEAGLGRFRIELSVYAENLDHALKIDINANNSTEEGLATYNDGYGSNININMDEGKVYLGGREIKILINHTNWDKPMVSIDKLNLEIGADVDSWKDGWSISFTNSLGDLTSFGLLGNYVNEYITTSPNEFSSILNSVKNNVFIDPNTQSGWEENFYIYQGVNAPNASDRFLIENILLGGDSYLQFAHNIDGDPSAYIRINLIPVSYGDWSPLSSGMNESVYVDAINIVKDSVSSEYDTLNKMMLYINGLITLLNSKSDVSAYALKTGNETQVFNIANSEDPQSLIRSETLDLEFLKQGEAINYDTFNGLDRSKFIPNVVLEIADPNLINTYDGGSRFIATKHGNCPTADDVYHITSNGYKVGEIVNIEQLAIKADNRDGKAKAYRRNVAFSATPVIGEWVRLDNKRDYTDANFELVNGVDDDKCTNESFAFRFNSGYVVKNDGTVWVCGSNSYGRLGLGHTSSRSVFTEVPNKNNALRVEIGYGHSVILNQDGTLSSVGRNGHGQLGLGDEIDKLNYVDVNIDNVIDIACGYYHTLALKNDGTIWGTGGNWRGMLGIGDTADRAIFTDIGFSNVKQIACGENTSYMIAGENRELFVTGDGYNGELGLGATVSVHVFTSTGITGVLKVSANVKFAVIVKEDGTVWGTGENGQGQLGLGHLDDVNVFTDTGVVGAVDIKAGERASYIVKNDGTLWASGYNYYNHLVLATSGDVNIYTPVIDSGIKFMIPDDKGTYVIKYDNTLWCVGDASYGEFGGAQDPNTTVEQIVTNVSDMIPNTKLETDFSNGLAYINEYGNVYRQSKDLTNNDVILKDGNLLFGNSIKVRGRFGSMYVIKDDGSVWVSGGNSYGELGLGDYFHRKTLVKNPYMTNVKEIYTPASCVFVLKNDGTLWSSGENGYASLGLGDEVKRNTLTLIDIDNIDYCLAGVHVMFVIKKDGTLWGTGNSVLNPLWWALPGYEERQNTFVELPITDFKELYSDGYHLLIRKNDDTMWGWGYNSGGQLGLGHNSIVNDVVETPHFNGDYKISTSCCGTSIIKEDGTLWVCGNNNYGQLGLGDEVSRNILTLVNGVDNIKKIFTSSQNLYILKYDGTLWSSGFNSYGQLGLGDNINRSIFTKLPIYNIKDVIPAWYSIAIIKNDTSLWLAGIDLFSSRSASNVFYHVINNLENEFTPHENYTIAAKYKSSFLIKADGGLWATGNNNHGQLGLGDVIDRNVFVDTGIKDVKTVDSNLEATFIIKNDGSLWVCGENTINSLGLGDNIDRHEFTLAPINDVDRIQCGDTTTYVLKNDNTLWGTGVVEESSGLGVVGGYTTRQNSFVDTGVSDVYLYSITATHLILRTADGEYYCWGKNESGQLGLDHTNDVDVLTNNYFPSTSAIYAGKSISIKQRYDRMIETTGLNNYGQLGLGDEVNRQLFTLIPNLELVSGLYYRGDSVFLKKYNNDVVAFGRNDYGQLGLNDTVNHNTPTLLEIKDFSSCSVSETETFFKLLSGEVYGKGLNDLGQLGLGDTVQHSTLDKIEIGIELSSIKEITNYVTNYKQLT